MQTVAELGATTTEILNPEVERKLLALIADLEVFRQEKWFSRRVNIFEAAGLYRQEIRHSNFLAYLLNPQQRHGLGDAFLKRLIQKVVEKYNQPPISALKAALGDFSSAQVWREWRNIDLFVEVQANQIAYCNREQDRFLRK